MRIGWIGVGNLATPIVRRLAAAGFEPVLYDLRPPEGLPGRVAASLAEAADADAVFSTLPSDAAFESVGRDVLAALRADAVYCDMSTVSPEASARVAAAAGDRAFLRAPVSGSVSHAEKGILTVIASGPRAAYDRLVPVFEHVSAARYHVGEGEEARVLKLIINDLVGSTAALMAEGLTLGRKAGLDWETMLTVIGDSAVASPLVKYKADVLKTRDFAPAFTTDLMVKDMALVAGAAKSFGCQMPLAEATLAMMREHAASGGGAEDFFAVLKLMERKAGL